VWRFVIVFRPGRAVALVCASGAGKSTCVKLVARFHDPTRGRVLVGFIAALNGFFDPIGQLSQVYTTYQSGMAALDKIFELLDVAPELTDRPDANSIVDLVKAGRNVIGSRTFSRIYGLAGLRIGYTLSTPENAARIGSNIMTIDLSTSALAAAIASLDDTAFMTFSKNRILEARGMILDATRGLRLETLPSQANFVFVRVPDADALKSRMADRGIIIRGAYGKWNNWSRVSTGKIEDVRRYAAALPAALRA